MKMFIKVCRDEFKTRHYVLYEHGELSKPLMILSEFDVLELKKEIESSLGTIFDEPVLI